MCDWESIDAEDEAEEKMVFKRYEDLINDKQDTEGFETVSSDMQDEVETTVLKIYQVMQHLQDLEGKLPLLARDNHVFYLKTSLTHLSQSYECLDSSRPWLCYWILHALQILGERLEDEDYSHIAGFLAKCQSPEGGFGGGPGQHPHLATTYAAVNALCTIGTPEAYQTIDRQTLCRFLSSLRDDEGAFSMHIGGEVDIRGAYCAVSVARLTNVYHPEMFKNTGEWIASCQTWEGGFGGCPGMEAHGGYTFCALAALLLLEKSKLCDISSLLRWTVNRQMRLEGGFQGRTNKLVDGCYSFWQGGAFPLIHALLCEQGYKSDFWLYDQEALQKYLLACCQHPSGGLLDKPDKPRDVYHTCYTLSGLSVAQNSPVSVVIGSRRNNAVDTVHPVYNLVQTCASAALNYFNTLKIPELDTMCR
ncbi:protein farnesyltransferase subunit beta [Diprion similis]|uniref:protein farnesyltransferase subunit beta n=1 Tax=Diprion similis TaxID=362088 RepID=UPI001EF86FDA|nr:protein farnesyltransferase subunit beta [Diprion similis]XP_046738519.1 protein farnesyltransferase subunit beta [Diprion similis]XP_046738520.1 protein farnesyltransferase subunit beta [Diprion similis]XP_046738521.1 protein farnesyltransferase subunit beta [Diprion similis]